MACRVHVAVGVIINNDKRILIAKRSAIQHQGGMWEFPGGKVEAQETVTQALKRELLEEVGIDVIHTEPFMEIQFDYSDKAVLLDVHLVTEFQGNAKGLEGQEILWVAKNQLESYQFPEANMPILQKILSLSLFDK